MVGVKKTGSQLMYMSTPLLLRHHTFLSVTMTEIQSEKNGVSTMNASHLGTHVDESQGEHRSLFRASVLQT